MITEKEYRRFNARLRAYRQASWKFRNQMHPEKSAAIMPRLKLQESQEKEVYQQYMSS